ncbi:MAG: GFA family protein [Proteobacteria bacterium]|nr:GFA family protein [Pseudomonadota bacterium]
MTDPKRFSGGCLCGALRYEVVGEPLYAGHCYCEDCRKASGSGFIPFMGVRASGINFSGPSQSFDSPAANGGTATRNFCPRCGSLVFGGQRGLSDSFTVYVGSLDDPSLFHPTIAIFTRDRPEWALIPPSLKVFARSPRD